MTPAIITALEQLKARDQLPDPSDEPPLEEPVLGKPISHAQILTISRILRQSIENVRNEETKDPISYHLDDLLRGSQVYIEPPKVKQEPTSEYKVLMARLRREEEDRAYERMTNPPPKTETFSQRFPRSSHADLFPVAQEDIGDDEEISYADINRQMALIINILISIVACSVAIWLAARHWSTPSRLGLSMGGSGAVAVAEAVVYAGYLRRLKDAREKGKKEVEIKEIIKTWIIGGEEQADHKEEMIVASKVSQSDDLRRRNPKRQ